MGDPTWTANIQRSCPMIWFHFFFGMCLIALGWTTVASRWVTRLKPYHRKMGQIWSYGMIVQLYTSTYCSYNGFRWFIFMFGMISYGSLIIGHYLIRRRQHRDRLQYKKRAQALLLKQPQQMQKLTSTESDRDGSPPSKKDSAGDSADTQSPEAESDERVVSMEEREMGPGQIGATDDDGENESETGWLTQQRLKTIHGIFMTISLIMLTGAGAAFSRRFLSLEECNNIYCDTDGDGALPLCWIE